MATDQLPESLAWVERGSVLIRRMNSERIAEDPRVRRLLLKLSLPPSPTEVTAMEAIAEENAHVCCDDEEIPMVRPSSKSLLLLDAPESFEAIEADIDADDVKQESENTASNTSRVLLWTYRLHASLQSTVQYALFAKTSEDGCFIQIAPRVYCVAPPHITTFNRLFSAYSSTRNWNAAVKVLELLDAQMAKRFEDGACVFDCGLFDGVKRMHHKPLVYDEFCDGRIASISFCRGPIPSMHSGFVVTSTVAAWLDLKPSNVAILLAPNHEQMSVFATCCTLYCTDASSFPETFGNELLSAYLHHIKHAESWPAKLHRPLSGLDPKNTAYTGGLPRPQARYVTDFGKLLEMRDRKLMDCADMPAFDEKKHKMSGIAVTPAARSIYIQHIELLPSPECDEADTSLPAVQLPMTDVFRPYFVIQSEKGVLFSSMVNGVRNVNLHTGRNTFRVGKQFQSCSDLVLKMYHLPFGRRGELIFESRLHASILLELQIVEDESGLQDSDVGVTTLSLENGDFDCISSTFLLPKQFMARVLYAHNSKAFPAMEVPLPIRQMNEISSTLSEAAGLEPSHATRASTFADRQRRDSQTKAVQYDGPSAVTFFLAQPGVRTPFGDLALEKIDVIRQTHSNRVDIYLLFHVDAGNGHRKVLPLRHLFRYPLPAIIREKLIKMGASVDSLNDNVPSSFNIGAGIIMPFDEEYARWLQHLYETDLDTPGSNYDDEVRANAMSLFVRGIPAADVQPSLDYRIGKCGVIKYKSKELMVMRCNKVSIETDMSENLPPAHDQHGRRSQPTKVYDVYPCNILLSMLCLMHNALNYSRGASALLINQLPTYTFSASKERNGQGTPDCLICRCSFEVGEEIKSLPCFHSYHSDCVGSWLSLNKVCPVCQFSVDHTHH
ncbi:hypothetical protein CCR75_006210 [Bremia lactucae]|uniref:RING-type domain-containing protein n=1 Tax=Bremia lactucae TaxID=4779 RepID=A0A976IDJ3_BRELC|nr:hypothetical protein CCR75_006210 [Bremia lactucae]